MNNIQLDYPATYLMLCALIALLYAAVMYMGDKRWKEKSNWIPLLLGIGRAVVVFILAVLLLSPFLTFFEEETEPAVVILAHDNSESITMTPDSVLDEYMQNHVLLTERLSGATLEKLAFGSEVRITDSMDFSDKKTNISELFDYIQRQYAGRNIAAIILASDGLYNVGQNPIYATGGIKAPIYTLPLGDSSTRRDLSITEVFHNQIAFLNDRFTIQADIEATRLSGKDAQIEVFHKVGGQFRKIDESSVAIDKGDFFKTVEFTLPANRTGMQHYRVSSTQFEDEISYRNNSKEFFIDIIDSRQKILIFAAAPHPDITAIRQLLSENDNYELELAFADDKEVSFKEYDIIFLHQIPFNRKNNQNIRNALSSEAPKVFITGLNTDINSFNQVQSLLRIQKENAATNAVEASYNKNFNAFTFAKEDGQVFETYPPLETFFGDFTIEGKLNVLFHQKIGEVETEYPLIALGEDKGKRTGFILGEGIWRWRLFDYMRDEKHEDIQRLLEQITQYVSLKEDRRRFRVISAQDLFDENERIRMRAEFFNESYELINEPDVELRVNDASGNQYEYTFGRVEDFYTVDLGFLPAGNYTFTAETQFNGRQFTYAGRFSVESIQLEMYQTVADHNVLKLLAEQNRGGMISPSHMVSLADSLEENELLTPLYFTNVKTKSLINISWVFWLLALLLSIEWVSRRLVGTY